MPLGRPDIRAPNTLQLQGVQQTINNIRERFAGLEAFVTQLQSGSGIGLANTSQSIRSLQIQIDNLRARIEALEAAAGAGVTRIYRSGEAIDLGAPVWVSDEGVVSNIDPDAPLASSGYLGIAAQTVVAGADIPVRLPGGVVLIPGSSFTTGMPLYAALGGVTHTPAGETIPVGVAISATEMSVGYGFLIDDSGGGILPVVTGEVPPVLVYLDDGSLVWTTVEA